MATQYEEPSEELVEFFESRLESTTIAKFLVFKVLSDPKQLKDAVKIVKNSKLANFLSEGIDFAIIVNETVYDQLTPEQQTIAIDESLAGVSVSDTDVVSLNKPDLYTHTGVMRKYGDTAVLAFKESQTSLYDKAAEEVKRLKAESAGKRGRKPKTHEVV
jgi:hypothetical protein